jgi:hypothetical protein
MRGEVLRRDDKDFHTEINTMRGLKIFLRPTVTYGSSLVRYLEVIDLELASVF